MNPMVKKLLPHFIAVVIFAAVAIIYCQPALQGKVLQQSDVTQWKGMAQDALNYREKNGHTPYWTNSMFGGMPTYQITGAVGYSYSIGVLDRLFTLGLPEPINLFFLAAICFYFLAQVLGFNPIISIIGGLAYSYATYNPIIIIVGHITKMHAIAYMPFFIGSILLLYKKQYLWGGILTAISTALFVQANHLQITYYGIIIAAFITLYYLIEWFKAKSFDTIWKTASIGLVAGAFGLAINGPILVSTYEYGKVSIRGGSALTTKDSKTTKTGLNKDYAFQYSMYPSEPLVLMFPNLYGGSSDPNMVDPASSKAIETLQQTPQQIGQYIQRFLSFYWGGIGFTAGPPYIGIVICLLALIGFSNPKNKHKWWIATTILVACLLSAGSFLEGLNVWVLNHVPFYNKFRAPSMIMVIPTLLIGVSALYGMDSISTATNLKDFIKQHKIGLGLIGLVFILVVGIYLKSDFKGEDDKRNLAQWEQMINQQVPQKDRAAYISPANDLVNALATDRKTLLEKDITRSIIFVLLLFALLLLASKKIINQTITLIAIGILSLVDLFQINIAYLNKDHFVEATESENVFQLSPTDIAIKKDKSQFRVLDMRNGIQNAFNGGALVAYHHHTVGGYNPAKLSIYQDLIENQWYKFPNCAPTMNMLNTKYIISGNIATDTIPNPNALGNVWFVQKLEFENGPNAIMKRLDNLDPAHIAIIDSKDKNNELTQLETDSNSQISLISNNNDDIVYKSSTTKKQFAVFSEIYYNLGWKAYIDGKESTIYQTNYVLRGLIIPAGQHEIKFEFRPTSIENAKLASGFASIVLWGLLIFAAFKAYQTIKNN